MVLSFASSQSAWSQVDMSGSASTRTIAINNIETNFITIADRRYPLIAEVYAVIRKDAAMDSPQRKLYLWLLSEEGQSVVKQSGYVPIFP